MTHRLVVRLAAAAAAAALAATTLGVTPSATAARGKTPLGAVLVGDGVKFDRNRSDFDITERAVLTVLDAKPKSPVGILLNGARRVTVFLPTDNAFRFLVADLTGNWLFSERQIYRAVRSLGVDTVEAVLLYHVIPGKVLNSPQVVATANRRGKLATALGPQIMLRPSRGRIAVVDADRDDTNARTVTALLDISRGNRQVAHGIDRVLRPADL